MLLRLQDHHCFDGNAHLKVTKVKIAWGLTSAVLHFRDKHFAQQDGHKTISMTECLLPWGRTSWEEGMGAG